MWSEKYSLKNSSSLEMGKHSCRGQRKIFHPDWTSVLELLTQEQLKEVVGLKETGKAGKEQVVGAPSKSGPQRRNSGNQMSSVQLSAGAGYEELELTVGPGEGWLGNWDNPQV